MVLVLDCLVSHCSLHIFVMFLLTRLIKEIGLSK